MMIELSDWQNWKALLPIFSTESGIMTDVRDLQNSNIETPIVVGDTLMVGEKRKLKLSIKYNEIDSLNQPNPIQLNLDSSIVYGQL